MMIIDPLRKLTSSLFVPAPNGQLLLQGHINRLTVQPTAVKGLLGLKGVGFRGFPNGNFNGEDDDWGYPYDSGNLMKPVSRQPFMDDIISQRVSILPIMGA